ncbi:hypothetical protein DCC35_14260 [Mangrovivirga cuniculi]|uniref:CHRD domain-containing protein n=2 Tax=Mangrovivirga cuniculi TaxID=2715131 RepID=A0A4D7JYP4_9BACT|nr:hypothetical protein DCC35_14260 [Mangrovivirga cuniculi]
MILAVAGMTISCDDDDEDPVGPLPTGDQKSFILYDNSFDPFGTVLFEELDDNTTRVTINLNDNTGPHPAHIHSGSTFEQGSIVVDLTTIENGTSVTVISELNDGTGVTYADLINLDGYVAAHVSPGDLTVAATADLGPNEVTGNIATYPLYVPNTLDQINGGIFFVERGDGNVWVAVSAEPGVEGMMHPMHIHDNSAAETGGIAITLNDLNGTTDFSATLIEDQDFATLSSYNGYVNIHESADNLQNIVAQGDIGSNALTGTFVEYTMAERNNTGVSGVAQFYERAGGHSLLMVDLTGTIEGTAHPSHIHFNSAEEGGGIAIPLTSVDGTTGMALTTIREDENGAVTFDSLTTSYDGYLNVHLSGEDLTVVSQSNIGGNVFTGSTTQYAFAAVDGSGVEGTATFNERLNGSTWLVLEMTGTAQGNTHPSHIHSGSVASPGGIAIDLSSVEGGSGMSMTNIDQTNAGDPITYEDLTTTYEGYINVHLSAQDLSVVSQTNIGASAQ